MSMIMDADHGETGKQRERDALIISRGNFSWIFLCIVLHIDTVTHDLDDLLFLFLNVA